MNIENKFKGLVTKKFNEFFFVDLFEKNTFQGNKRYLCKIRKSVNFKNQIIFVGDEVLIDQIDINSKRARIDSLLMRKNRLNRPAVANISDIYVTFSVVEPQLNLSQVNKFLISSEQLDVNISLVLTKCDLITNKKIKQLKEKFQNWGYCPKTIYLSNEDNFNNLFNELKTKKCSIFMGPSGVGKTTLLNKIIPGLNNLTAEVSSKIKRGKNTTRNVELFALSEKSYIVDTPGFNMQSIELESKLIAKLFPEIRKQILEGKKCKFRDCLHLDDPGCNINKNFDRYNFYKELVNYSKNYYPPILED